MKQVWYSRMILGLVGFLFLGSSSCSVSGRRATGNRPDNSTLAGKDNRGSTGNTPQLKVPESGGKTTVKMKKVDGIYEIPTEINGVPMRFIFDTGAGLISISENEINMLEKEGKFSKDDITGHGDFVDANGDISEGTIITLRSVKIGDRVLTNVQASVVHNLKAPLLMGQSALENFGTISIDYKKEEITFE